MGFEIIQYDNGYREKWDRFVENESMNGTFLQTRKFIDYHPKDRFNDCSVLVLKGKQIVACILACVVLNEENTTFFSHKGTSFGGLIISRNIYNASAISELMDKLEEYFYNKDYKKIILKMTPSIFAREKVEMLDYFLFQRGYSEYDELNYFLELKNYKKDILQRFSASKRRDYRYSLKYDLEFKKLNEFGEIKEFYEVLISNLEKLGLSCIHSLDDLIDIKFNRFNEEVEFYGVFWEGRMIAGSMTFCFYKKIMHTQYLASDKDYLKYYPMDYLIYNLIEVAIRNNMQYFTFGICTENQGKYLNMGLSRFKEGFGTEYCINRTYFKEI